MTFGLYFKDLLEIQLKRDNIYYPDYIKNFVNNWNVFLWNNCESDYILLLSNIIYKEIFCFLFFNKNIDINLIKKCFKISCF